MFCTFMFVFIYMRMSAYVMRISYWSSDLCSSVLVAGTGVRRRPQPPGATHDRGGGPADVAPGSGGDRRLAIAGAAAGRMARAAGFIFLNPESFQGRMHYLFPNVRARAAAPIDSGRSEEHTSELQSLMRISYAVFFLKKKKHK